MTGCGSHLPFESGILESGCGSHLPFESGILESGCGCCDDPTRSRASHVVPSPGLLPSITRTIQVVIADISITVQESSYVSDRYTNVHNLGRVWAQMFPTLPIPLNHSAYPLTCCRVRLENT